MMDAMEVAAALRREAENAGCALDTISSGREGCPDCSCAECCKASAKWANDVADAIERCAMPVGVEWPRFEDGGLVKFGDFIGVPDGAWMEHPVDQVLFTEDGNVEVFGDGNSVAFERGETAKRIVLAADGEPLEVGQTVYLPDGTPVHVTAIGDMKAGQETVFGKAGNDITDSEWQVVLLTHQRPILDADGVPIREGDTVYGAVFGGPFTVTEVSDKGSVFVDAFPDMGMHGSMLTHTNPEIDTWERIEEDARGLDSGVDRELFTHTHEDIVRRCRALAERGE